MTEAVKPSGLKQDDDSQAVVRHMRAIEAEFAAEGLTTHLTDARAGLDLSAEFSRSGRREAEIWVDEDGCVEVRYWSPPGASADQIAATAIGALRAMTSPLAATRPPFRAE
jgi:hypothetical protein